MSTFKTAFLTLLQEDNIAGGVGSVFGAAVGKDGGIYNPNEGRYTSNDSIYAPGDARVPKAIGGVQRRGGISKLKRKKRKTK
jgi:hypothetical protein